MNIRVAKNKRLIGRKRAEQVSVRRARRKGADVSVQPRLELRYKRLYFFKLLAFAARTPFKPRKIDYTLFYDPVLNQGGVTNCVPDFEECEVGEHEILAEQYTLEDYEKQREKLIEKNILRSFLLKRPELQYIGMEEVYLPYWVCTYSPDVQIIINAATARVNI